MLRSGFDPEYDGSQDYKFLVDFLSNGFLKPKDYPVKHIPKVLYHWRKTEGSVAADPNAKPYALDRARDAAHSYLSNQGVVSSVLSTHVMGLYRPHLSLPREVPSVNIVIPTKDHLDLVSNCLKSLMKTAYSRVYVTIVDNGSTHKKGALGLYQRVLSGRGTLNPIDTKVHYGRYPFNFSKQSNTGAKSFDSDYVLFLNNDTEVIEPYWLHEMVSWLENFSDVGAIGARLLYPDGTLQHGGVDMGVGGVAGHSMRGIPFGSPGYFGRVLTVHETSAVTGACLLVRKSTFDAVGGFDEAFPSSFNDVDICLKIRELGYRILYNPWACLFHHESVSRGPDHAHNPVFEGYVKLFQDKWGPQILKDPYFNSNLHRTTEQYTHD